MQVLLGRRDGFTANNFRADSELPAATINVDGLINVFGPKGLTLEESVALIGGKASACVVQSPRPGDAYWTWITQTWSMHEKTPRFWSP